MNKTLNVSERQDILIKRTFDAPLSLVWKAWTNPEQVMRWWGPKDYTSPLCKIDLCEGGKYLFAMRAPAYQGGKDYYSAGVYLKIKPMEYLEFTQILSDQDGNPIDPAQIGMPADFPKEVRTTITFKAQGDKTEMTLTEYDWPLGQMRDFSLIGMNQSLDKLAESLQKHTQIIAEPGKQEVVITREFDAPRELVFKAFIDPDLYIQWLGPRALTMTLEKFEPRFGGKYRYIHQDKDGNKHGFHGVFHEVSSPERLIDTFEYEGLPEPGHVSLETLTFENITGGKTRLKIHAVFQSVADRDGMLQSGMESGVNESHERLDELLAKMRK